MTAVIAEEHELKRTVICEVHSRQCRLNNITGRCPCCGKRLCLCNYTL